MTEPHACECSAAPTLIFACSGAADVGEISDRAARRLAAAGAGKMFCLAGVGGQVSGIVESTRAAARILAIDGCPLDCARSTLEVAEIPNFTHLRVTDLGMKKGETAVTPEAVAEVAQKAGAALNESGTGD